MGDRDDESASGLLNPKIDVVIEAILGGATQAEAGDKAGVSSRTVRRYLSDPGVQRRIQEQGAEAITRVRLRVQKKALRAAEVLAEIAEHGDKDDAVRVAAARAILAAFVQLQPKHAHLEIDQPATVRHVLEGVEVEGL